MEPRPLGHERFKATVEVSIPSCRWRDLNIGDPRSIRVSLKELLSNKTIEDIKMLRRDLKPKEAPESKGDTTFFV